MNEPEGYKYCKDCKHYDYDFLCFHSSCGVNLCTGESKAIIASFNRLPAGNCKEQGLLFEQKELLVKKGMISRIISWFK